MSLKMEFFECQYCATIVGWVQTKTSRRPTGLCLCCHNAEWQHLPERYLERYSTNIKTVDLVY